MSDRVYYGTIAVILIIIIAGGVYGLNYIIESYKENQIEKWTNLPIEKTSCEKLEDRINDYKFTENRYGVLELIIIKWNEADCTNPDSENWKGDDWKYESTTQDRIDKIEEQINPKENPDK